MKKSTFPPASWGRTLLRFVAARPIEQLGARCSAPGTESPSVPLGLRVYAFGDVHGRSDLLEQLSQKVMRSIQDSAPEKAIVIGLGDYIDRGSDSRGVIDLLLEGFCPGVERMLLRGNHEDLLLKFLERPGDVGRSWFRMGGLDFLRSYGVDIRPFAGARPDLRMARESLVRRIPARHVALLESMPTMHVLGDYLFAHAGVRTSVSLDQQVTDDLLWVREGFSDRDEPFEKVVVHGHTPTEAPYVGRYRINVDTAAYASNRLSCVVLEGSHRQVFQAGPRH